MSKECIWSVAKKIRSETGEAREVLDQLLQKLSEAGWSDDQTFGIHLAVEEALMNAIKHGNKRDPEKTVTIEYELRGAVLTVVVEDEGRGFDPKLVPDPTLDENLELPNGRGLMLMRAFMTAVEYNETGNRVSMSKDMSGMPIEKRS
jgi:serine/threonine-protein kinase RsbW